MDFLKWLFEAQIVIGGSHEPRAAEPAPSLS